MADVTRRSVFLVATVVMLTACTSSGAPTTDDVTITHSQTTLRTTSTTPVPTISLGTPTEKPGPCPYLSAADFRDNEGDRVGRDVQLAENPVGCRFYFDPNWGDPTTIVGEIRIRRFSTATEAYNAMAALARTHPEFVDDRSIGDGSVTIKLPLQGENTWACVYARGNLVVIAHSRQTDVGEDARNIARALVPIIK